MTPLDLIMSQIVITLPMPDRAVSQNAKIGRPRKPHIDDKLREMYPNNTIDEMAKAIGFTQSATRNRVWRLGLKTKHRALSDRESQMIKSAYTDKGYGRDIGLPALAESLGRTKAVVCRIASDMGLTNRHRPICKKSPRKKKPRVLVRKYNKRFLGGKHTHEARMKISDTGKKRWAALTPEQAEELHTKRMKRLFLKYGTLNMNPLQINRGTWKAGWREIGETRKFYRSRWEANYARYLQWLKENGQIKEWKHESETFWFEEVRRGVRSYLPDFRVWENDGTSRLHEVKGWMDDRSKTVLSRMAKYHPHETIVLIQQKNYNEIKRKVGGIIKGWE